MPPPTNDLVREFLAARKRGTRYRWIRANHPDFAEARSYLRVDNKPKLDGMLVLIASRFSIPPKYSFSIIFQSSRIMALDVEPRRSHRNVLTGLSVAGTHWHLWPSMDAVPDNREFIHPHWFYEFARRSNISYPYRYKKPPAGEQPNIPGLFEEN